MTVCLGRVCQPEFQCRAWFYCRVRVQGGRSSATLRSLSMPEDVLGEENSARARRGWPPLTVPSPNWEYLLTGQDSVCRCQCEVVACCILNLADLTRLRGGRVGFLRIIGFALWGLRLSSQGQPTQKPAPNRCQGPGTEQVPRAGHRTGAKGWASNSCQRQGPIFKLTRHLSLRNKRVYINL